MIVSPFKFMFGIVLCMAGVGSILLMLFVLGFADMSISLVCVAALMAGIVLGADSIESPNQPSRMNVLSGDLSEQTKQNFEQAIQQSSKKKSEA